MLSQGSKPMNRARCSGTSMLTPTLRRALILAVFLIGGFVNGPEFTIAQNSLEARGLEARVRITPSAGPADFFADTSRGAGLFSTGAFPGFPGTGQGIRAVGQPWTPSAAVTRDLAFGPVAWNRRSLEPSQPWIGTVGFGHFATGSIGFTGIGRQQGGGFDQFAGRGLGAPQQKFPSLSPGTSILLRNRPGGTASGTPPRFDARVASSFTSLFNPAAGAFRLSYREMFGDGSNKMVGNSGARSGSATFGTSNLGNGMFLSAGTSFGSRSTAGALAGGPKRSGPSVGLRLTF
jgi:hypothetical protein